MLPTKDGDANQAADENQHETFTKSSRLSLWYFLLDLLGMDDSNHLIVWTNQDFLEFRFVNPKEVAYLWGHLNGKDNMTYAKFSRAIRYYYGKGILEKIPNKRFHYRFVKSAKTKFAMEKTFKLKILTNYGKTEKLEKLPDSKEKQEESNEENSVQVFERLLKEDLKDESLNSDDETTTSTWFEKPITSQNNKDDLTPALHLNWVSQQEGRDINDESQGLIDGLAMMLEEESKQDGIIFRQSSDMTWSRDGIISRQNSDMTWSRQSSTNMFQGDDYSTECNTTHDCFPDIPHLNEMVSIHEISKYFSDASSLSTSAPTTTTLPNPQNITRRNSFPYYFGGSSDPQFCDNLFMRKQSDELLLPSVNTSLDLTNDASYCNMEQIMNSEIDFICNFASFFSGNEQC